MARSIALAACLIVAALIAWLEQRPPRPLGPEAPAHAFSAARAMEDVRVIGRVPHPVGSAANAEVRDHLLRRMRDLGLTPEVRRDVAVAYRQDEATTHVAGADVENLVGVLPGRDRSAPALAIQAHYDSVAGSPGAADDAAGVAAALEIVRALKAQGPPARDVMVVITDGEEAGLLGAQAFWRRDPLARRVGFVLNMEARGSSGRAQMFQTGAGNGEAVTLFGRSAVRPVSSSLAVFIYEHMPNDTDFTEARAAGLSGFNYAFIGRAFDYHAASATPGNLDPGSLQDLGAQVLAAAQALAYAPGLPAKAPDAVYAQTFGDHVLAYPPEAGWAAILLAAGLGALAVRRALRAGAWSWADFAQGLGAALYLLAGAAALLRLARRATGVEFGFLEQRALLAHSGRFEAALVLLGLGFALYAAASLARGRMHWPAAGFALAAGVACSGFGGLDPEGLALGVTAAAAALAVFRRPASTPGAWAGLLATALAAAVAAQATAPATAFLIAWPLVAAGGAAAISGLAARRTWPLMTGHAALAAVGLAWLGGIVHGVYLGLDAPEFLAVFVWLAALLIWPLAHPKFAGGGRITAMVVLAVGVALLAATRFDPPWSARFPQETVVLHHQDADTGAAYRVSGTPDLPDWSRAALTAGGGLIAPRRLPPLWTRPAAAAPTRAVRVSAPSLTLTRLADGRLELVAAAPTGARVLVLNLRSGTAARDATLNGLPAPILAAPGRWTRLRWEGPSPQMRIIFRPQGPGSLEADYGAVTEAWPRDAAPLPPRSALEMPYGLSDSTVVAARRRLDW